MLYLQFDGLYRGAPQDLKLGEGAGVMCYGWVILRDRTVVARGHGGYMRARDASSNVAEYLGLIEGLEALLDMGGEKELVVISGDAKSVIEQMQGVASVSAASIRPLYRRARRLYAKFSRAYWNWTPRRHNHEADALTRRALRQLRANPSQYEASFKALHLGNHKGGLMNRLLPVLDLRLYQTAEAVQMV
jgi:ribonuclease HI